MQLPPRAVRDCRLNGIRDLASVTVRRAHDSDSRVETWLSVSPGKHEIVAHVLEDDGTEHRASVVIDAEPGEQLELDLVAGRALGRPLSLKLD